MTDYRHVKIAGVILAAGAASRMGKAKLLLTGQGETLIHHAARVALEGSLMPVVVITGSGAKEMRESVTDLDIQIVHNPVWENGQSTSVRAGIESLPRDTEAVIFLLGDQPFVSPLLLGELVRVYSETRPLILAPFVNGKRTNPVLFDRSIFPALLDLKGDTGARSIFGQYPPTPMPWNDERLLFDVDTPTDYERLIEILES